MREIYVFNCGCDGDTDATNCSCFASSSQWVHWKRLFNNKAQGTSHTAKLKESQETSTDPTIGSTDPFIPRTRTGGTLRYANIQNGLIMFSSGTAGFNKVRLVYNGMGGEVGDEPIIPRWAKRAIVDYVAESFFSAKMAEDTRAFSPLWNKANLKLNDLRTGSWAKARRRVSRMSTWEKDAMDEYMASIIHK